MLRACGTNIQTEMICFSWLHVEGVYIGRRSVLVETWLGDCNSANDWLPARLYQKARSVFVTKRNFEASTIPAAVVHLVFSAFRHGLFVHRAG